MEHISIAEAVDEIVPSYSSGTSPNSSKHIDDPKEQEGNLCLNSHSKIISEVYSSDIDVMEQLQEINNKDVVEQLQEINNEDYLDIDVMKQLQGINNEDNLGKRSIGETTLIQQSTTFGVENKLEEDFEIQMFDSPNERGANTLLMSGTHNVRDVTPYLYKDCILHEMITTLAQPDIIMIGLYGSSYKSKDNAVEKIKRRVERDGQFDVIIEASLVKKNTRWNKSLDLKNIQEKLGNQLGLQLQEKTLKERTRCLYEKIKMKQNILIIFHDLQDEINLNKIGIPFGNDHKGCRILFLANNKEVLSNTMKIPIVFPMDDYS